jgi:ribonuclease HI
MDDTLLIFTDTATSPQRSVAIGAFICLDQAMMQCYAQLHTENLLVKLEKHITYQYYESKKSTASEILTVIDALHYLTQKFHNIKKVEVYTDCQSLCDLLGRRKEKLLATHFITRSGKTLQNAELYKQLYAIAEKFDVTLFKIKGHDSSANRVSLNEKIFAIVDKLSRKKLRLVLET